MSEIELRASGGVVSDNGEYLLDRLPKWMADAEGTGNWKLLDAIGRSIDRLDDDIRSIDAASTVQQAETVEQLEKLAELVGVDHKPDEDIEKFRRRILAAYQLVACEATINELLTNISILLEIDTDTIEYSYISPGTASFTVPAGALNKTRLTETELQAVIYDQLAAGFNLTIKKRGTFVYVTPSDYTNNNYDPAVAYGGLATDVTNGFTASTVPADWSVNGDATYDDTNDRIELNPKTTNTSGNGVYDPGIGGLTRWTITGDVFIDGGGGALAVNFYGAGPGTGAEPTTGYTVRFDNANDDIELRDNASGTAIATTSVSIGDAATSHTIRIGYFKGHVRVDIDGTQRLEATIQSPDYSYDGLSFGGSCAGTAGLHALSSVRFFGGDADGTGGTYAGVI